MVVPSRSTIETPITIACAHCGLPVPASRRVTGAAEQFCCTGCEGVWTLLHECQLDEYYRLRDAYGQTPAKPARISGKRFDYLDDPEFLRRFGEARAGGVRVRFYLDGVHCIACAWLVEKVLVEHEHARFAQLQVSRSLLEIVFDPREVQLSRLAQALDRLGYTPHPLSDDSTSAAVRRETRSLLARLGIAAACAMNIMLLAVSQYAGDSTGIEASYSALFRWVSLGLALPAVLYSAYPYYRGAWGGLRRGLLHMDLPISLGILATFTVSVIATVLNRGEVYYDSVSGLIALLLAGRLALQRATRRAADAGESLLRLAPKTARLVEGETSREVLLTDIREGDRLRILPGETVPVDGRLDSESAWIKEAHLTGEPAAIHRTRGDTLCAGSIVETTPIELTATAVGETTRLFRLAELMREAATRRAPIVTLMDRVASYFVAGVLLLALLTVLIWLSIDPARALWNTAAVLVVACPCALGLATPVALAVAMGRAARRGLYIKGPDGIERLARVNHVILDKTGTLTEGQLRVLDSCFADDMDESAALLITRAVAALERFSGHVIATAFADVDTKDFTIRECRVFPGAGVEGQVSGQHLAAGSESFIAERVSEIPESLRAFAERASKRGHTLVWVACDRRPVAVFALGDRLHPDATRSVAELRAMKLDVEMISGDHPPAVAHVAKEVAIQRFRGGVSPEQKLAYVEALEAQGQRVAMVGDGVNDAAALGRASVGISVAGAAEVARDAADVFISAERGPAAISEAIRLARRALRIVRINLAVSVSYNLIGAMLAVTGHVTPLVAAILMPISSLTVLLIASRG